MIISFYPGSGGNRFYLWTKGQRNFDPGQIYDYTWQNQDFAYRYLDSTTQLPNQEVILTHCVNIPLLKKLFPGHDRYVLIKSDMVSSLKREWQLDGRRRVNNMPNAVENALAAITYHQRYYQEYQFDSEGATDIIDLADDTEFSVMMRQEIAGVVSPDFDRAVANSMTHADFNNLPGDKMVDGFKSKFLDDAEKIKLQMDRISPSLCLAKWKQVSLHLTTGLNNSCYHPPLHAIPIKDITANPSSLHNTPYKKQQRKQMLDGVRPEECGYCWAMEDKGKLSDRHYRSGEAWAVKDFGKIVSSEWDDDINPSYMEVNFNHACNLACSYCSPQFSSSWQAEIDRFGGYPTSTTHNDPSHFTGRNRPIPVKDENPYVEAFWRWWPDVYPELEHFRMTGGEPLMDKNTYRVFDYVLEHPSPKLHLNVTSNLSVEQKLWDKYMGYVSQICDGRIEHFMQFVSLDGWGNQAEYMRHGLDFDLLWSRVDQFLTEIPSHNSLTFIVTMNNLSVTSLQKLLAGILDLRSRHSGNYQRVWFDTPVLRKPEWQSLQILPDSYVYQMKNIHAWMKSNLETPETRLRGFKDYEIQRMDRDIAWMQTPMDPDLLSQRKADFYRFFNEHDARRNTDFLKTFPEMKEFWNECQYNAKQLTLA